MTTNIVHNSEFHRPHAPHRAAHADIPDEKIRERAYFIFLARGGEPGNPSEDWSRAERELRAEAAPAVSLHPSPAAPASEPIIEPRIGAGVPAPTAVHARRSPVLFSGG